jgi:hypothetical protein
MSRHCEERSDEAIQGGAESPLDWLAYGQLRFRYEMTKG